MIPIDECIEYLKHNVDKQTHLYWCKYYLEQLRGNKKGEIWRDIKNYEGHYQVSNFGRVRSLDRVILKKNGHRQYTKGVLLRPSVSRTGYYHIVVRKNCKQKGNCVHQLVWDAFGDKPRNGKWLQVDHIDNIKANNGIDNLQLLTPRQNSGKNREMKGVVWVGWRKRYVAKISYMGKIKCLGYFKKYDDAHKTYLEAKEKAESEVLCQPQL